jgi:subtilisin family serine protease
VPISEVTTDSLGSHYCHATFIAGLIRIGAPDAQVLPIRVMSDAGAVSETNVIDALTWLMARMDSGQVVDVVNMSFGRPKDNGDDDDLPALRGVITRLHQRGVRVVVSAGNGHSSVPNVPGSFAAETGAPVVSVGAGVGPVESQRAPFSNYGDWVHAWRVGTDVISINPIPQSDGALGFAQWSGTSFSAAIVTGEFAQEVVDRAEQPVRPSAP